MTSHERGVANLTVRNLPARPNRTKVIGSHPSAFKIWAEIGGGNTSVINTKLPTLWWEQRLMACVLCPVDKYYQEPPRHISQIVVYCLSVAKLLGSCLLVLLDLRWAIFWGGSGERHQPSLPSAPNSLTHVAPVLFVPFLGRKKSKALDVPTEEFMFIADGFPSTIST